MGSFVRAVSGGATVNTNTGGNGGSGVVIISCTTGNC